MCLPTTGRRACLRLPAVLAVIMLEHPRVLVAASCEDGPPSTPNSKLRADAGLVCQDVINFGYASLRENRQKISDYVVHSSDAATTLSSWNTEDPSVGYADVCGGSGSFFVDSAIMDDKSRIVVKVCLGPYSARTVFKDAGKDCAKRGGWQTVKAQRPKGTCKLPKKLKNNR